MCGVLQAQSSLAWFLRALGCALEPQTWKGTSMKQQRRTALAIVAGSLALVPILWAAQAQTALAPAPKVTGITLTPAADAKWVPMPGLEGAQQSPLWGDPTKGAHGILYKWPASTKVPEHTHTYSDRGVVVSGTLILAVAGAPPKKLPPGSYFAMAGGIKHATSVDDGAPCVFFLEREGPFDVHMVEPAGKQ